MIRGIDIYHGDELGQQDFISLTKQNNLYFIFIKATTGGNGKDPRFVSYWDKGRKAGLVCGAYHFFWPVTDTSTQANNFFNQYKQVSRAGVLPPVVDIEWTKTKSGQKEYWNEVPGAKRVLVLKDFLHQAELLFNIKPIIYTAHSFWKEFISPFSSAEDDRFFGQYKLWIADPNNNGRMPSPWATGRALFTQDYLGDNVPATAPLYERLDHDVFNGSIKDFLNNTVAGFTLMKGFPFSFVVKDIQDALVQQGFLNKAADGFFGQHTEQAVMDLQTKAGLTPNGIIDAQTWNKLLQQ